MKLLLLDKDGTLIQPKSGAIFVNRPWDQEPLPGVVEALKRYVAENWELAIISNQGGIPKHKSLESAILEMQFCLELFLIREAYFCPNFEGSECWRVWEDCSQEKRICYDEENFTVQDLGIGGTFRKPGAGMLKLAISIYSPDQVLYVGDRDEDQQAAIAANIPFMSAEEWRNGNT